MKGPYGQVPLLEVINHHECHDEVGKDRVGGIIPIWPSPLGITSKEVIGEFGMTKDELATRTASKLSLIFKGEKAITADTALQLEKVVGVPAHIWLGLESEYRLSLVTAGEGARTGAC